MHWQLVHNGDRRRRSGQRNVAPIVVRGILGVLLGLLNLLFSGFGIIRDTPLGVPGRQALQFLLAHGLLRVVIGGKAGFGVQIHFELFLTVAVLLLVKRWLGVLLLHGRLDHG